MSDEAMLGKGNQFSNWSAVEPPADFARRVALLASEENAGRGKSGRGLVIPLLLAAFFVSVGAAAAWDVVTERESQRLTVDVVEASISREAAEIRWAGLSPGSTTRNVPESIPEAPTALKVNVSPPTQIPPDAPVAEEQKPTPPRKLHLPRCECGTSATICTCVE